MFFVKAYREGLSRILLLSLFLTTVFHINVNAQPDNNPVKWSTTVQSLSEGLYQINFTADIESPWHMYDLGPYDGGPNATSFTFESSPDIELVGGVSQVTNPIKIQDALFGMEIGYYEGKAVFAQKVRLDKGVSKASLKVNIEWMVCDDGSCLPPTDQDLVVTVTADKINSQGKNLPVSGNVGEVDAEKHFSVDSSGAKAGISFDIAQIDTSNNSDNSGISSQFVSEDNSTKYLQSSQSSGTLWAAIIEAILWGFAALLTPCVFPMVPMTVSFFMKSSDNPARGRFMAALYGLSIVALYTLPIAIIILVTQIVGGDAVTADIFNWLATHWLPNVIFFLVFMLFALSFFGAFEIRMPGWLVNKSDSKADKGGLMGIFFMALTLVLVSFSCTGPIVGSVLIKSTSGEVWEPVITMLAFSVAFALPFTLFAFFPSLLKNLPKSGGWLNSVKVVLGFIELALGLKFLSVADQTYHWGILDREIYLALWIVIFALLGFYLLGKIRFAYDEKKDTVSVGRLFLSIVVFSFVVYMIPGMWGAPLKAISGYLPPLQTQDFVMGGGNDKIAQTGIIGGADGSTSIFVSDGKLPKYSDFLTLPYGLQGFFDLKEAESYAAKVNKPLFVDYTGHGCVNCREMEARVWSDPKVLDLLRNKFVVVALYSDDKKQLPESEWITTDNGKVLKTLGKINAYIAHKRFGINSQPYYMILGRDGQELVKGMGYNLDVAVFERFLQEGINKYGESKQ